MKIVEDKYIINDIHKKNLVWGETLLLLFKDLNQRFNIGFDIILYEQEETSIYKTAELDSVVGTVGQKIFREFKVIDYRVNNKLIYYLLSNKKEIIGWVHLNESLTIYRKAAEPSKILNTSFTTNDINLKLQLNLENFDISKIYMSKSFVIINGEVFEGIYSKNKLMGFFKPEDIDHSRKINEKINVSNVKGFYLDSGFLIKAEEIKNNENMLMIDYFPILQIGRLKYDGNILWAKIPGLKSNKLNRLRQNLTEMSYSDLLAIHLAHSFDEEREKSKKIIKSLLKENKQLIESLNKEERDNSIYSENSSNTSKYKKLYNNLKTSRLGKIQIAYWRYLERRRKK